MIHSFTVNLGAKYLTDMVTSVPPYETLNLIKNNILHQSKIYKNHFENSNFWGMWPLVHVGHVTYSFINMLFISTGIFYDKLCPQILLVGTTANAALSCSCQILLNFKNNDPWHWIKAGIDLGYCNPTSFQTRGHKVQKLMFLLFVLGEFIFHLILMKFLLMNSFGKSLSECIMLLCNYYHFRYKRGPRWRWEVFQIFYFSSNLMQFFENDQWWAFKKLKKMYRTAVINIPFAKRVVSCLQSFD